MNKYHGPVEVTIEIGITDGDVDGVATVGMAKGVYCSAEDIKRVVDNFAAKQMPEGFRLMTKREWWDAVTAEKYPGSRIAMPGSDDWDETDNAPK